MQRKIIAKMDVTCQQSEDNFRSCRADYCIYIKWWLRWPASTSSVDLPKCTPVLLMRSPFQPHWTLKQFGDELKLEIEIDMEMAMASGAITAALSAPSVVSPYASLRRAACSTPCSLLCQISRSWELRTSNFWRFRPPTEFGSSRLQTVRERMLFVSL